MNDCIEHRGAEDENGYGLVYIGNKHRRRDGRPGRRSLRPLVAEER